MTRYTVTAERGTSTRRWVLQCVEHPGALSEVTRLDQAGEAMREAIGFVAQVDPGSVEIDLRPVLPAEVVEHLHAAKEQRALATRANRAASEESRPLRVPWPRGGSACATSARCSTSRTCAPIS